MTDARPRPIPRGHVGRPTPIQGGQTYSNVRQTVHETVSSPSKLSEQVQYNKRLLADGKISHAEYKSRKRVIVAKLREKRRKKAERAKDMASTETASVMTEMAPMSDDDSGAPSLGSPAQYRRASHSHDGIGGTPLSSSAAANRNKENNNSNNHTVGQAHNRSTKDPKRKGSRRSRQQQRQQQRTSGGRSSRRGGGGSAPQQQRRRRRSPANKHRDRGRGWERENRHYSGGGGGGYDSSYHDDDVGGGGTHKRKHQHANTGTPWRSRGQKRPQQQQQQQQQLDTVEKQLRRRDDVLGDTVAHASHKAMRDLSPRNIHEITQTSAAMERGRCVRTLVVLSYLACLRHN